MQRLRLLLWALPLAVIGLLLLVIGMVIGGLLLAFTADFRIMALALLPGSALVVLAGLLGGLDLLVLLPHKRRQSDLRLEPLRSLRMTAVLTAYNDEESIGLAVEDFRRQPSIGRVLVVDNNSLDATAAVAARAGAEVVGEPVPGYGSCVHRALSEAVRDEGTSLILLCEGDCTFRAADAEKLLAYLPHADIVNGTRIVEQLRHPQTQLTTFMYYGNFFVGKLLEAKHLGAGTFTDIGTTYKLCRREAVVELLPHLNPAVNLEFNAHLLDTALARGLEVVECPITFHPRVGRSKGGNTDNWRACAVGLGMIKGLLFGWPKGDR
jgi:hypothetical protein